MRRRRIVCVVAASVLTLSASACGNGSPPGGETRSEGRGTPSEAIGAKDFDRTDFGDSTNIDNAWLPLKPGTQWVWEGHAFDGKERIRRRVVTTVTDLTKVVDGVRVVVAYDLDYSNGELGEAEIALFAQDSGGNVWHFGEYPEEYDGNKIVKTPAWISGVEGARAGIAMQAAPQPGTPSYAEGWGPQVGWNDRAATYKVGERICVPVDCYKDVLVTREFSRTEPGAFQLKYYAPDVGNVRVGWGGPNEEEREVLVLVDLVQLTPEALAKVRQEVLAQDRRGYEISKDVYGHTTPAEQALGAG